MVGGEAECAGTVGVIWGSGYEAFPRKRAGVGWSGVEDEGPWVTREWDCREGAGVMRQLWLLVIC